MSTPSLCLANGHIDEAAMRDLRGIQEQPLVIKHGDVWWMCFSEKTWKIWLCPWSTPQNVCFWISKIMIIHRERDLYIPAIYIYIYINTYTSYPFPSQLDIGSRISQMQIQRFLLRARAHCHPYSLRMALQRTWRPDCSKNVHRAQVETDVVAMRVK